MPKSTAELWQEYLPRLAEAKEQDREEITRAFLPLIVPLGRFKIVPPTIERLLWLEQIKSPFLVAEREPTKEDVIAFIWICSPDFKVGFDHGRKFGRRHCIHFALQWKMYAKLIAEFAQELMRQLGADLEQDVGDGKPMSYDWLPTFVDGFASQYHWTERDIMNLPIYRVGYYAQAMLARLDMKGKTAKFAPRQDKVRATFLRDANDLNAALKDGEV